VFLNFEQNLSLVFLQNCSYEKKSKLILNLFAVPDPCLPNPCLNGGFCLGIDFFFGLFGCICQPGYTGDICEIPMSEFVLFYIL